MCETKEELLKKLAELIYEYEGWGDIVHCDILLKKSRETFLYNGKEFQKLEGDYTWFGKK